MEDDKNKQIAQVLLIEDDAMIRKEIVEDLKPYETEMQVSETANAGEAVALLSINSPDKRFDAYILDIMLPYAEASRMLNGNSDPDAVHTGERLLRRIRDEENGENNSTVSRPAWVSAITARSNPQLIQVLRSLLGDRGKLYIKPFSTYELVHDLALVLGIKSKVPLELLPKGYTSPLIRVRTQNESGGI